MAFIRRRLSGPKSGRYNHQILESYRDDGKVKHRVVYSLGRAPTIAKAIENAQFGWALFHDGRWPPAYLERDYGRDIPPRLLEEAERKRDATLRDYEQRITELQRLQQLYPNL
jgi:hypothetical protein